MSWREDPELREELSPGRDSLRASEGVGRLDGAPEEATETCGSRRDSIAEAWPGRHGVGHAPARTPDLVRTGGIHWRRRSRGRSLVSPFCRSGSVPWHKESIAPWTRRGHRRPGANRASSCVHAGVRMRASDAAVSRERRRPRTPGTPSMIVPTTRASPICPAPRSNRSRSRTARSPVLPTSIEPSSCSRWLTQAVPAVNAASASIEVEPFAPGRNGVASRRDAAVDAGDRDLHLEERVGASRRSSRSPSRGRAGREQRTRTGTARSPARGRGTGSSGRSIWPSWIGPQRLGVGDHVEFAGTARCRPGG